MVVAYIEGAALGKRSLRGCLSKNHPLNFA